MFETSNRKSNEPPSLQPTNSPKTKVEPRRLRASCDACYLSKVKCGKETPTCARCLNHAQACSYSPSQRVGKPRRLREEQQSRSSITHDSSTTTSSPRSTSDASVHPPPYSWNLNFDPSVTSSASRANLNGDMSMLWQRTFLIPECDGGTIIDDASYTSSLPSPSNSLPTPVESVSEYPATSKPSPCNPERMSHSSHHHQQQQSIISNELMLLQDDLPQLYYPQLDLPQIPDPSSLSCNCATTAFDILRNLHEQSANMTFDRVLAANKSALNSVSVILSCPCRRDSTSIMTLAVAITKIMSRYQSISNSCTKSAMGINAVDSQALAPLATPITLGAYRLDSAEEEQIKKQVILSELRKVDGLMAKFQERFCTGSIKHEARIYSELATFLRRRLRDIVEGLQRDLQLVYEGSSF